MERSATTRRRPHASRGDVREARLLEIAEGLLRDGGFEATSIADIAATADITRSAFYFYFASKEALLERLIETTLAELIDRRLGDLQERDKTPAERLHALLHGVAEMWVEHGVVLSAAAELAGSVPALFDRIAGVIASGVETLTPILAERDPDADPEAVRETVSALLWMGERTFYVLARSDPSPEEYHALADRLFVIWVRAVGIDNEPAGGGG
jgi:TetR/AcrR family transcriptional regulator, ethionamide resistance regulator